jgi:glucose/arabinose dehydrogenase
MFEKRWASLVVAALVAASLVPSARSTFAHDPGTNFGERLTPAVEEASFNIRLEPLATGFDAPNRGTIAPGDPGHLYLTDQTGILWAIDIDSGAKTPFLDVTPWMYTPLGIEGPGSFDERGLLGVAFHPDYESNGLLYTYLSVAVSGPADFSTIPAGAEADHQNVVVEWKANDPKNPAAGVDPARLRVVLRADWPEFNHNGGDLHFGPDRMLYISMGDGGHADDQDGQLFRKKPTIGHQGDGNGQKLNTVHGKFLRIDVNGRDSKNGQYGIPADNPFVGRPDAVAEIWAYGFRNPWRFSFDRDGNLWVGDIGQNDIEEINLVTKGGNYGWSYKEGTFWFEPRGFDDPPPGSDASAVRENPGRAPADFQPIEPVAQYDTHWEGHSSIGGHRYYGSAIPELYGKYVFGEFGRVFVTVPMLDGTGGRLSFLEGDRVVEFPLTARAVSDWTVMGFGQDARGEVYVMTTRRGVPGGQTGAVMRILPAT